MDNYVVNQILYTYKITDYLEEKGFRPVRKSGSKYVYTCPLHKGDNSPSFMVYEEGHEGRDFQTYHCFGCNSGITIFNLMSKLEGISVKEAFVRCAKGIDIPEQDLTENMISNIVQSGVQRYVTHDYMTDIQKRDLLFLHATVAIKSHLSSVNYDKQEVEFFEEKVFPYIERVAKTFRIDILEEMIAFLREKGIPSRMREYIKREESLMLNNPWK